MRTVRAPHPFAAGAVEGPAARRRLTAGWTAARGAARPTAIASRVLGV